MLECAAIYIKYKIVRDTFEEPDETLKFKISKLILEGPEEELKLTKYSTINSYSGYSMMVLTEEFKLDLEK